MPVPQSIARLAFAPRRESDRYLPEGPRLVHVLGRDAVAWVNIQTSPSATRGDLHIGFLDNGERRRFSLPARPGFLLPTELPDTLLIGLERAIGLLNLARGVWTPIAKIPDTNPRVIINDGELLPGGHGVLFGTKDLEFREPLGQLYLLSFPEQMITTLASGMTCSNGKIVLPIGSDFLVYDIDTPRRVVERYYLDGTKRELMPNGIAIDLRLEEGLPDGMVHCGDGSAIVAFYNPNRGGDGLARRYRLDTGRPIEEWVIPGSPRVTCPLVFLARDKPIVLFTTADEGMNPELRKQSPNAGCLFISEPKLSVYPTAEVVRL